jgi:hypothetical protein
MAGQATSSLAYHLAHSHSVEHSSVLKHGILLLPLLSSRTTADSIFFLLSP